MDVSTGVGAKASAALHGRPGLGVGAVIRHDAVVVCRGPDGRIKWVDGGSNLIMTVGLNDIGDQYYGGSTYTAAHYIGLRGTGSPVAGDTMSSITNWTEITAYDESTRQTLTLGSFSSGSANNTGNEAVFTASGTATVAGVFCTTDNTKSGTTGVLVWAVDFSASRSVVDDDTLTVTVTCSFASA